MQYTCTCVQYTHWHILWHRCIHITHHTHTHTSIHPAASFLFAWWSIWRGSKYYLLMEGWVLRDNPPPPIHVILHSPYLLHIFPAKWVNLVITCTNVCQSYDTCSVVLVHCTMYSTCTCTCTCTCEGCTTSRMLLIALYICKCICIHVLMSVLHCNLCSMSHKLHFYVRVMYCTCYVCGLHILNAGFDHGTCCQAHHVLHSWHQETFVRDGGQESWNWFWGSL